MAASQPSDAPHIDANLADRLDQPSACAAMFAPLVALATSPAALDDTEARLAPVLRGLARHGQWRFLKAYSDTVGEQLKTTIKQVWPCGGACM